MRKTISLILSGFELLRIKLMVAQRKPVSFINRNRKYFLNPDKSTAYHIINSTEKIERMVRLINSDAKTIFDVGANCGIFSAFAARKLPSASIYAFEPSNNLIPFIKMNCSDLNVWSLAV